jgi:hypothetical protein
MALHPSLALAVIQALPERFCFGLIGPDSVFRVIDLPPPRR